MGSKAPQEPVGSSNGPVTPPPPDIGEILKRMKPKPRRVEIVSPGSKVLLHNEIHATVLSVRIGGDIQYEVCWMDNRQRCFAWVSVCELALLEESEKTHVGFIQ